jgi:hypothetical protein
MSVEASDDGGRFKFIENLTERDGRLTEYWLRSRVPDVVDRQVRNIAACRLLCCRSSRGWPKTEN